MPRTPEKKYAQFSNRQLIELILERTDDLEADVKKLVARDQRLTGAAIAISFLVSTVIGILGIYVSAK